MRGIRAWFHARVRERITLIGALYVVALLLTGLAAFASANNLLFLILAAMLGLSVGAFGPPTMHTKGLPGLLNTGTNFPSRTLVSEMHS